MAILLLLASFLWLNLSSSQCPVGAPSTWRDFYQDFTGDDPNWDVQAVQIAKKTESLFLYADRGTAANICSIQKKTLSGSSVWEKYFSFTGGQKSLRLSSDESKVYFAAHYNSGGLNDCGLIELSSSTGAIIRSASFENLDCRYLSISHNDQYAYLSGKQTVVGVGGGLIQVDLATMTSPWALRKGASS